MKCLHFGDLHIWQCRMEWGDAWYPKRWLGFLNLSLRRHRAFPPRYAERIVEHILASDADTVVFSGDMSTMSLPEEFARAAELLAPLRERWGARFFVIPGNHDRYTPRVMKERRYEHYFPYGRMDQPGSNPKRLDLNKGFTLVGFDCSEPFAVRSNGILRPRLEAELDTLLGTLRQEQRTVILVGHFPFSNPAAHPESWDHRLLGEDRLAALVARHRPAVYLHGHKHVRWTLRAPSAPDTVCFNCGSAGMQSDQPSRQAGFVTFRIAPDGTVSEQTAHELSRDASALGSRPLTPA